VSMPAPYPLQKEHPLQMELHADLHITRWRPLVQWLLAIPHLMIAYALRFLRQILTLISFFAVLFTEQIPRQLFDAIVMTYRYEWRAMSYALFMHEDYPPFDFALSSDDDGAEPHTSLRLTYPEHLDRWQPLYKWFLAIPQYFVLASLAIAAALGIIAGFFAVLFTGKYPEGIRASWSAPTATRSGWRPTSVSSPIATRLSALPPSTAAAIGVLTWGVPAGRTS
jgi:hypothetical protein